MTYNPDIHHRKSTRLPDYDYSQNGMYFITICTEGRQHLFGEIIDGEMSPNLAGKIINQTWENILNDDPHCSSYISVLMPNHFHAIIQIENVGANPSSTADRCGRPIGEIIGAFKSKTTNQYIKKVHEGIFPSFEKRIWQRNFHEHIIRNEESLEKIYEYIKYNPINWETDCFYL